MFVKKYPQYYVVNVDKVTAFSLIRIVLIM